jgi:hypothetical protein
MGGPKPPKPLKPPPPPDLAKAQINSLAYAELERRIKASSGRGGSFITRSPGGSAGQNQFKTFLGQ